LCQAFFDRCRETVASVNRAVMGGGATANAFWRATTMEYASGSEDVWHARSDGLTWAMSLELLTTQEAAR